jgi:hypothetical protein
MSVIDAVPPLRRSPSYPGGTTSPSSIVPLSTASRRSVASVNVLISSSMSPSVIEVTSSSPSGPASAETIPRRGAVRPPYIVPRTTMRTIGRRNTKNRPVRSRSIRTRLTWAM